MSSPSVSLSAAPWRGATAIFGLWIALWSFFILAVAAPAAELHRASASASLPASAVAAGEPHLDGSP